MSLPFTGREFELQQLRRSASAVRAGHGTLLLLAGEAGSGKTTLLQQFAHEAHALQTVVGRCSGTAETQILGPWKEVASGLARLGHNVAPLPYPFGEQPGSDWSPEATAEQLLGWMAAFPQPLLIVLEDIHWADPASLEMLGCVAPLLSAHRVLLVASYRSDEVNRHHPLWGIVPHWHRIGAGRMQLDRLTAEAIRELVVSALPNLSDPAASAAYLYERTKGNALFVHELLREAVRAGVAPQGIAALPETLQQAIDAQLDRLSPTAAAVLQVAALIGERFSFDLLTRALAQPEETVSLGLEEALRFRVIQADEMRDDRFQFSNALVREAVVNRLVPIQRRRLHRQIADALLEMGSLEAESLAYHLGKARDIRAVNYLTDIGDRALRRGMLAPAGHAYDWALELLPDGDERRPELLLKAGQTQRYRDIERANLHWDEAIREGRLRGKHAAAVWARTQALNFQRRSRPLVPEAEVRNLVEETEPLLQDPDYLRIENDLYGCASGYPRSLAFLAEVCMAQGRFSEAEILVEQMVARTAPGSNPYPIIFCRVQLAWFAGRYEEYLALLRRMADLQYETRYYRNVVGWETQILQAFLTCRADRPDEVDAQARQVSDRQRDAQERSGSAEQSGYEPTGLYRFMSGQWASGSQQLEAFLRTHSRMGREGRSWAAAVQIAMGRGAEALQTLAVVPPVSPEVEPGYNPWHPEIGVQCLRAEALIQCGDMIQARAWLDAADRWMAQRNIVPFRPSLQLTWAEFWLRSGEFDLARTYAREGLDWALSLPDIPCQIEAQRLLGRLAIEQGRGAEAKQYLDSARTLATRCRLPLQVKLIDEVGARLSGAAPAPLPDGLSAREGEIIRLVAQGLTDKQIGAALFISPRTVDGHLRRIFAKVGVTSRSALAAYAARHGLDS